MTETPKPDDPTPHPTGCPFCGSTKLSPPPKKVDALTYWRCEACGQIWNVSRQKSSAPGPYRNPWNNGR